MDALQAGGLVTCAFIAGFSGSAVVSGTETRLVWPLTIVAVIAIIGIIILALA